MEEKPVLNHQKHEIEKLTCLKNINCFEVEMKRGYLILIEGLDRSGKSTQTQILFDKLQKSGHDVELLKFPGTFSLSIV